MLKLWNLPDPVVKACAMHQNKTHEGQDEQYVKLIRVTNFLLHEIGIEYEGPVDIDAYFEALGLTPTRGREIGGTSPGIQGRTGSTGLLHGGLKACP